MNFKKWLVKLGGAALALTGLAVSTDAHAQLAWRKLPDSNNNLCASSVALPYALSCTTAPGGGKHLYRWNSSNRTWSKQGSAEGTSLTRGEDGAYYLVGANNTVWRNAGAGWAQYPTNRCEGGNISLQHTLRNNNIAVGVNTNGSHVYVIESVSGTDRSLWWNGSCWFRMPALPSGSVRELAVYDDPAQGLDSLIWARNANMEVFRWTGATWVSMAPGLALGMIKNYVIGSDGESIWYYDQVQGWIPSNWTFGPIEHIGPKLDNFNFRSAIDDDGDVWVYGT